MSGSLPVLERSAWTDELTGTKQGGINILDSDRPTSSRESGFEADEPFDLDQNLLPEGMNFMEELEVVMMSHERSRPM